VTSAFTLILGAVALGVALAFGLGNRDLAGEITRRWYERGRGLGQAAPTPAESAATPPPEPPAA